MEIQSSIELQSWAMTTQMYLRLAKNVMTSQVMMRRLFLSLDPKMRRSEDMKPKKASKTEYLMRGHTQTSTSAPHSLLT